MCNAGSPPYYAVFLISAQLLWGGLCTSANCASERTLRMSAICLPSQLPSQITMTWTPDPSSLTEGILEAEPYRALIGFAPP
ncbi:hypothetical protein GE21DRAFT_1310718 [Neurospora crassa]|nr:hypothetical protein GE21DRAFT_1310718 [Neurospora crassa]